MPENEKDILKSLTTGSGKDEDNVTGASSTGINYIIAIGIDKYAKADLSLQSCVKDCEDLTFVLESKYKNFVLYEKVYNEKATKKNIIDTINKFCNSPSNSPLNNLILYYSGHGGFVQTPKRKIGSWIPYDFNENQKDEYLRFDDLLKEAEFVKTTHLLIISDSCFAGELLKYGELFTPSEEAIHEADIGLEPSRWGLASSRKNEQSAGGKSGENSAFTKELIAILDNKINQRLLFSQVVAELRNTFSQNNLQRIDCDKLSISPDNTGEFIFEGKNDNVMIAQRKGILKSNLMTLNYDEQRKKFSSFKEEVPVISTRRSKQIAFLSGTPSCGLRHFSSKLKNAGVYGKNAIKTKYVFPPISTQSGETEVLQIFNLALDKGFPNLVSLNNYLLANLQTHHVILEIRFYKNEDYPSKYKLELVNRIISFIEGIDSHAEDDKRLLLIVLDEEQHDYEAAYKSKNFSNVESIFFPMPGPLSYDEVSGWYDKMKEQYVNLDGQEKELEFDTLFESCINKNIQSIIEKTKGFPGSVIGKICEEAGCDDLIKKILDP
jgi:hypothetical protein